MLEEDLLTFILAFVMPLSWEVLGNFEEFVTGVKTAEVHTGPPDHSALEFCHPCRGADNNNVYFLRWL